MHVLVQYFIMNHQCTVMNNLKLVFSNLIFMFLDSKWHILNGMTARIPIFNLLLISS